MFHKGVTFVMRTTYSPMVGLSRVLLPVSLLLLNLALSVSPALAQASAPDLDPYPLRPADTSSPRVTLRSFLTNAKEAIDDWRQTAGARSPAGVRAKHRAFQTLDFSATPDGSSRFVRIQRMLLLKEVLDRIELPPDDKIPGDEEVADGAVTQWTIPDTRITIRRLEGGPRAGEFLFSADTVQRLDRFYRQAKHLPYKQGDTGGSYEEYIGAEGTAAACEAQVRNRLRPVDTSNPRSTLEGFLDSVNRAYTLIMEAEAALQATPPTMTREAASEIEVIAANLLARAMAALDLSQVPEALREDVGVETALQLKEIIDRTLLPPLDAIPDAAMVAAARERDTGPVHWRYPNTAIEIMEIKEGERHGQFLFSAESVERIPDYYEKVRGLPYRRDDHSTEALQYLSPGKSEGAYKAYISTPGYLIPHAHFLGRLVHDGLPDGLKTVHGGQTDWQWIGLVLSVLAVALASYGVIHLTRRLAGRLRHPLDEWLIIAAPITVALIVMAAIDFIDNDLNITGDVLAAVTAGGQGIVIAMSAWVVFHLVKAIAETIVALPRFRDEGVDASLLRLGANIIGFPLGAWVLIEGLHELGVDMLPLLAGLGVGGLALALAARPTIEKVIGSLMIVADRPYKVGQRVKVMGQDGNVESIGLRSTKIRLLSGHLTTIPNEKMATVEIENIGQRPYIRRVSNIAIPYDTPPEKVTRAEEIIQEILAVLEARDPETSEASADTASTDREAQQQPHPNEAINQPDFPPRVFFNDFNPASLNILVVYWFHPPEYWDYLAHARWINLQIMERFKAEGIDFAFPTQTLHLAGDEKRPLTVGQRWASEEEDFSQGAVLAQAAALGARTVLGNQIPASESARPQPRQFVGPLPQADGKLTGAPLEDDLLGGDAAGDADEAGDDQASQR